MTYFQSFILAVVEGVTEFLPVSSTGHLILASAILKIPQSDFVKSFELFIQLGAIFAILFLYRSSLFKIRLWLKVFTAFLPTAFLGLLFYKTVKRILLGNVMVTVTALLLGGIFMIVFEIFFREKDTQLKNIENFSYQKALMLGVGQSLSFIPGVSRAMATIFSGIFLGLSRKSAVEFSFLLAVPTMFAATILDVIKSDLSLSAEEYLLLGIGFAGSFLTALIVVKYFITYINKHNFILFGVYRIIISLVFFYSFL